jgi:hypothetical protein
MGKFRDMFKVRQPGHGGTFQREAERETSEQIAIENKGKHVPNGGEKKGV